MTGLYPTSADNVQSIALKMATNYYNLAIMAGITGLTPPSYNDPLTILFRKTAYYTAALA